MPVANNWTLMELTAEIYVRGEVTIPTLLRLYRLEERASLDERRRAYRLAGMSTEAIDALLSAELQKAST